MNKVRKKFVIYAMAAVLVLLTVLLAVINGINFTMVAEDADRVTEMIAGGQGEFGEQRDPGGQSEFGVPGNAGGQGDPGREGGNNAPPEFTLRDKSGRADRMGPDSPELAQSLRYFTVRFSKQGDAEIVDFRISALDENEAVEIARGLTGEKCGWVDLVYRYRVYKEGGYTYVTVVDQGRELLPSYRILLISVIGEVVCLAVCLAFLIVMSKKIIKPIEEADRKQKQFLAEAECEFKIPLTVIDANTEIIEKTSGANEQTKSINRQVRKMISLTKKLSSLSIVEAERKDGAACDLSLITATAADLARPEYEARGIALSVEVESGVSVECDAEAMRRAAEELVTNGLKYAKNHASFRLERTNGRIILTASNGTDLPDGQCDQVFDRFTRLPNSENAEGDGLGLSFVKEVVKELNGRQTAFVKDGEFTLKIML